MLSRFGKRILLWIIVLAILPLGLISLVVHRQGKNIIRAQIYTLLNITADSIKAQVLNLLNSKKNRITDFSSDGFIRSSLERINKQPDDTQTIKALSLHLKNKASLDKDILDIFIFNKQGKPVASTNEDSLRHGEIEAGYFLNGKDRLFIGTMDYLFTERHFHITMPIRRGEGSFLGVITMRIKGTALDNILTDGIVKHREAENIFGNLNNDGQIYVVDADKNIIVSRDKELIGKKADTELIRKTLLSGKETTTEFTGISGDIRIGASMYLKEPGWIVIASVSKKQMFASVDNLSYSAFLFIFGSIIVVISIITIFTKRISHSLSEVSQAATSIALGHFGERISVKGKKDEIADVANTFNKMAVSLQETIHNLTEREEKLAILNRFYSVLLRINEAIIRFREPDELFTESCRICVDEGLFRFVWVGLIDPETSFITPVARYGHEEGFLDTIGISKNTVPEGCGHRDRAIREGRYDICNDIEHDPRMEPWREEAIKRGYRSSAAFPLKTDKGVIGVFCCYASAPNYFDGENTRLLKRMTGDISYAIEFSDKEKLREQAEDEIKLLQSVTISIAEAKDLHSAIEVALTKICDSTKWSYGEAWLLGPDRKNLVSGSACYCVDATEETRVFRKISEEYAFSPGTGLPGRVWATKKPEWIRDVSINHSMYLRSKLAIDAGLHAALGVPIIENDEVLAVLVFYMSEPSKEEERHINLVSTVVAQLGSIIRRKLAEEEKAKLETQVRHMQKMEAIGRFTGGIAHDFNNILTAIIGNATLIQRHVENDPKIMNYLEQVLATAERAANLTRGLLVFSRKQIIDIKPIDLNKIIRNVEKLLLRLIGEDVELKVALDGEPIIRADAGQIEQALMNMVTNARDAMPKGGHLSISTKIVNVDNGFVKRHEYGRPGMHVLLTVSDTGTGMDAATKEKVFEPFFTTKEVNKGTGLGLSIVYGIIKQHEGYINVYSEPGKGTTFRIYLPVIEKSRDEALRTEKANAPRGGTETILLAEDDAAVRQFVKTILEEFGYSVIEATDGEDAIDKYMANKDSIKLLVLDVIMPKKTGKEVYDNIIAVKPDMKTLFTSGYNEEIIHTHGVIMEGLNFVSKPFIPTELLRTIRAILDK